MKTNHLILSVLSFLLSSLALAQTTPIPDPNFEDYLETHAEDGSLVAVGDDTSMGDGIANNGLVYTNRINTVIFLDVGSLGISDLTGIEAFDALETLICSENNLTAINIANNANLISLLCGSNSLFTIDVSNNLNLESLNCSDNQIESLDLGSNSALKSLTAPGNQLASIDVSNNSALTLLSVSNNRIIGELNVGNNVNLESLFCASNQISTLDLTANTVLKNLDVSNNALTSLDLSQINTSVCPDPQTDPVTICQGAGSINVSRNQLTSLIVANGYNDLFMTLNSTENPDLFCIQIDAGFTPSSWIKDDWTYYSDTTCVDIYTFVPDDNFEQALIDLSFDDVLDNLVLTANIDAITDLNVSNASITSLVGIEDFSALEILDCSTNSIEDLDLTNNIALEQIDVMNNDLTVLDVTVNTALTALYCASNFLSTIDVSNNSALSLINCSNNVLTSINVISNPLLTDLDCSFNQIESLNVEANTMLSSLLCNDNNLFALNMANGSNTSMTTFNATTNVNLFCVEVDDVAFANGAAGWQKDAMAGYSLSCGTYIPDDNFEQALIDQNIDSDNTLNNFVPTTDINTLISLNVSNLSIIDLTGIQDFTALQEINCSNNSISSLDVSNNTVLEILDASNNQITNLDVVTNTALMSFLCNNNALLNLNVENGNNNLLTVFDATNNPNLFCINIDDAVVGNIPGVWQKDDFAIYNGDCMNSRFTAIPDSFFEQTLIDLGYDDVVDSQVLTANIEHVLSINVSDRSISDLTGIQDFKSLIELDCSGNYLDELDISGMVYLERLNCSSNFLLTNNISDPSGVFNTTGTIALKELFCAGNNLNNLDTSLNTNLEVLECADNNLATLNIDNNGLLRFLNCSNNNLTTLDISSNGALENVNCNSNQLNDLNTSGVNNTALTMLSCANNNLSTLMVTNYQALTTLNCGANALTALNLTNNTALSVLVLNNNQISEINLINNTNLKEISASQNSLTQLDVTANTLLVQLNSNFNDLTDLTLDSNPLLQVLSCSNNQITALNLTNNTNVIEADVSSNVLTSLILSNSLGTLKSLNASNNQLEGDLVLTTMAVSACVFQQNQTEFCPENISINLSNNLLSFVNIQNGINSEIANFNASGNPNLECIQVDNTANIGASWIKDDATTYNVDCNFGETFVPDDNFEQTLINLGYDSGPLNDYVLTENIEALTSLDVSGNAIADLTGIEDFIALTSLNVSYNALSELDTSANINLLSLECTNNVLSELNVENNTELSLLHCASNSINTIEGIVNTNLSDLNISDNSFIVFVPSDVASLQIFNCDNNGIVELDFQQNQFLESLSCQSNALETLNIRNGQNTLLTNLNAQNNPDLTCIETDTGNVPTGATWMIDTIAQFAIECFFGQTFVPDDNFEQALIDMGYDFGVLDDYVLTENIQDLSFLNISGREISDLTGIEAFNSLTSLDIEANNIQQVNLSTNVLLINLDVSANILTELNLLPLTALKDLDVSNNELTALNVDANLALEDLNVSGNILTALNVALLDNLQELNCASNQLSSLDVTQNPNLTQLFCQSNAFIADQLNIQNGNNENLQLFNATNNPDLGCILVDDPVAVISNTDSFYDNWLKDESASYQTICADADNDGVANVDDLCPNTPFGATVNLFGCAILDLSNDNFAITITGETCLNSNNGKITIVAQELYSYTVSLFMEDFIEETGEDFYQEYNFTNDVDIFNLLAGTYEMCITIEEWPDYYSCYTVSITEPNPLMVFANRLASGDDISVAMSGNTSYTIEFNGETFITQNANITLPLIQGINHLKVSTDIECQGVFEERILLGDHFLVYPNPFEDEVNVFNGAKDESVSIDLYNIFGQLVMSEILINNGMDMILDTSNLDAGLFIMYIETEMMTSTHKIVKK